MQNNNTTTSSIAVGPSSDDGIDEDIIQLLRDGEESGRPIGQEAGVIDLVDDAATSSERPSSPKPYKLNYLPGKTKVGSPELDGIFEQITQEMMINQIHMVHKGKYKGPWTEFADKCFYGYFDKHTKELRKGVLVDYDCWETPTYADKFRENFIVPGVMARAASYSKKCGEGKDTTPLEERCLIISRQRESAQMQAEKEAKESKEKRNKRKNISEGSEIKMGLRFPAGKKTKAAPSPSFMNDMKKYCLGDQGALMSAYGNLSEQPTPLFLSGKISSHQA